MPHENALHTIDWIIVVIFILGSMSVGLMFTKRAGKNIESFFASGRTLTWYICGMAWVASGFASDTPLWVSALVRSQGIHYAWKYWAMLIGWTLAAVLFARLWRRLGVLTDVEILEHRYDNKLGSFLRLWEGGFKALIYCPLIIAWVVKAMEVISREAMGLPQEYQLLTTAVVVGLGLIMCTMAGLTGVVATGTLQFCIATAGTILLAIMSVHHVGGVDALVAHLKGLDGWRGQELNFLPHKGDGVTAGTMPIWNILGLFGVLWWSAAYCGDYAAQRVLSCKNGRNASFGVLFFALLYFPIMAWPWITVGLCSLVTFPLEMAADGTLVDTLGDSAYPRMMVEVLPIGLKGFMVAALIAAFISTITTLFNWGSSYTVNDLYKRFLVKNASDKHYVRISRIATVGMAILGGCISYYAVSIEQLLKISWVILPASTTVGLLRWLWWRQTAAGDLAGTIVAWLLGTTLAVLSFDKITWTDGPRALFDQTAFKVLEIIGLPSNASFILSDELLGARMLFLSAAVAGTSIIVSLLSKPTKIEHLKQFVLKAKPPKQLWKKVIEQGDLDYDSNETLLRIFVSWLLAATSVTSLVFAIGKLLLGEPAIGLLSLVIFVISTIFVVKRTNQDFATEDT
ncbi:MAG: sodium:solute symporter family transporter [Opitutaceae bacterium]